MDAAARTTSLVTPRLALPRSQRLLLIANACGLVVALAFLFTTQTNGPAMHAGEVAGETIVAQRGVTYVDHVATAARVRQIKESVAPVYRTDLSLARQRRQQAAVFLGAAGRILSSRTGYAGKQAALQRYLPPGVPATTLQQFVGLNPQDFKVVENRSLSLLEQATDWQFDSNQVATIELNLLSSISPRVTVLQRAAVGEVLAAFLAPTLQPDERATLAKKQAAAAKVPPVINTIEPGTIVVRRGDLVTPSVLEKLDALGVATRRTGWRDILSSVLYASVIVVTFFWYLYAFHAGVVTNPRLLLLLDACLLAAVIGARLLSNGHVLLPYFLPVAAASTFAAVVIAPEACVAMTLAMAVLAGWVVANSFELTMYYFLSGTAGVLAIRQVRELRQFIVTGIYIMVFALATSLAFGVVDRSFGLSALEDYVAAAVFNGFVSSTLALGGFALLADLFGVTTVFKLLELGQPSQPLLRRLMVKAPGTYNHSLIVATMVERAAEEVGASSSLARLGALYHDVGKTSNPLAFVENQLGVGNMHDELRPQESARIIRGHVSQGLRLARQYGLPRPVLDAIAEHHGTMTIAFFLHKARQENGDLPIDTSLYTYAGPKPQSKETALLMLADGCESAVRSTHDHSPERIRDIVSRIFQERMEQGQLSECPLTMHDLEVARNAFCSVLNGLYHPRIEYPESAEPGVNGRGAETASLGVPSISGSNEPV